MSVSRWTYFLLGFIASWHCGSGNSQTAPPPTPKPSDVFCPVGWTPMDGQFCMWKSLDSLPWDDALASCRQNLSHLLILHDKYYDSNEAQSSIIFSNIRNLALDPPELSDMWVGIHVIEDPRRNVTKLWWEADVPLPVRRTDKDKVTLFDWTPGQPNLKRGRCGAVFYVSKYATPGPSTYDYSGSTGVSQPTNSLPMERFSVTLANCSESRKFICVREATPIVIKSNFTDDQCPSDWYGSEYLDTCYKAFNFQKTFSEANAACKGTKGGSLAIPYDNTTMRFILKGFEESAASSGAYDFWTGIYYNNKTTVNGKVWRQNISAEACYSSGRPMADLANSSCLYMKIDGSGQERWCYGNCNYNRTFICQINASPPDPPKASVESKNLSVSVKNCSSQTITCNASHYHPCKPVIWIKDGFYIDNGYPPEGLTLTLDQNLLDKLPGTAVGSLQGEYRCEVWGQRSEFRRSSSDSAGLDRTLVIFEDTATFRGTVSYDKSKWEPALNASVVEANSLLYWTASDYRKINSSVSEIFGELPGLEIQLEEMKLGSVQVSCSLYYNYTIADEQALQALTGYLESSDSGTTWQRTLNDRVYQLLSRRAKASIWSSSLPSTGINWINLTSIDACPETTINGLTFRFTEFGNQANSTQLCPFDTRPKAVAICQGDFISGGIWTLMASVPCSTYSGRSSSSTSGLQQLAQTVINRTNVDDVIASAAQLTSSPEELTSTDVIYATEVLNNIATRQDIPKSVAVNFLKTVSNIAAVNETELQGAGKAARAIISAVDQFTDNVNLEESSNLVVSGSSVALQVWETGLSQDVFGFGSYETDSTPRRETYFSVMGDDDLTNETLEAAIVLSQEAINIGRRQQILLRSALNWNENLRLSFILYMDGAFFSNPAYARIDSWKTVDTQNISLNSYVISGSINGRKIVNLTDPVKIVFKQTRVPNRNWNYGNYSPRCVYWENDEKTGTWGWSTNGVWTPSSYDDQSVLGFSRHLTNFAIIAGFSGNPDTPIAIALKTLSVIGISISIAGLGLTILAQILFRALAKGRSQMVLLNLSVALLAVNILVLVGVDRTDNYNGCIAVAALLLYFLLASFCWMLVEGVVQYLKFVKVFDTYTPRFMLKVSLPAWGLPLIPVILVAAIDHTQFRGPDNYCWLKPHAFHFAFLLPLALIWMTNLIMFVLIIKGITCDRPKGLQSTQKRSRLVMLQVQAAACCCIVMGLTWLFCLLSVDGSVIAMDFLFCIFNSLQGFFIFLFLNVREKPVRQAWKSFFLKCCATCRREQRSKKSFNYVQKQSKTSISDSQESSWDSGFSHSTAASSSQKSTSDMELSPAEAELSGIETIIRKTSYYYDLDNKDCNMMY